MNFVQEIRQISNPIIFQGLDLKIRGLNADLDQRDENISRLSKEKKQLEQVNQQTLEDLQAMEDKANHLGKLKTKLEHQIEEVRLLSFYDNCLAFFSFSILLLNLK